jgi:protein TonB
MSMSSAKAVAVSAPRPEYPYEARRSKITGSGVCVMTVDPGSGAVTSATMAQSTGNAILDNAATSAFRRWRFKPGTVSKVRTPITFTMSGAQY